MAVPDHHLLLPHVPPHHTQHPAPTHCQAFKDVLLVFAEGRKYGCGDFAGQHDVVYKRSNDRGRTFGQFQVPSAASAAPSCCPRPMRARPHARFHRIKRVVRIQVLHRRVRNYGGSAPCPRLWLSITSPWSCGSCTATPRTWFCFPLCASPLALNLCPCSARTRSSWIQPRCSARPCARRPTGRRPRGRASSGYRTCTPPVYCRPVALSSGRALADGATSPRCAAAPSPHPFGTSHSIRFPNLPGLSCLLGLLFGATPPHPLTPSGPDPRGGHGDRGHTRDGRAVLVSTRASCLLCCVARSL